VVLPRLELTALKALKFHANRVIIAIVPATVSRHSGMPSAGVAINKLPHMAAAFNKEMG
jgi:hypothetical protein